MRRWLAPVDLAFPPTLLLAAAAVMVGIGGYEHAHLYHQGYSEIDTIGTLFLLNAIGSLLTILALLARRPLLFVVGSLSISFGSIIALVLTRTTGLFGFKESGYDGHAMLSLLVEMAAVPLTLGGAILAGGALLGEHGPRRRGDRDTALRAVAAVVVAVVLGGATLGVAQGSDDADRRAEAGAETTTTGPSGGTPPPTATTEEQTPPVGGDDAPAASAAVLDRGRELFSDSCAGCHTLADAEATGRIGPDLDQVVPGRSAAKLREDIVEPEAETTQGFPAGRMPSFDDLGEQQLTELVEYLRSVTR